MKVYQALSIEVTHCCDEDVIRTSSGYTYFNEKWLTNGTAPATFDTFDEGGIKQ